MKKLSVAVAVGVVLPILLAGWNIVRLFQFRNERQDLAGETAAATEQLETMNPESVRLDLIRAYLGGTGLDRAVPQSLSGLANILNERASNRAAETIFKELVSSLEIDKNVDTLSKTLSQATLQQLVREPLTAVEELPLDALLRQKLIQLRGLNAELATNVLNRYGWRSGTVMANKYFTNRDYRNVVAISEILPADSAGLGIDVAQHGALRHQVQMSRAFVEMDDAVVDSAHIGIADLHMRSVDSLVSAYESNIDFTPLILDLHGFVQLYPEHPERIRCIGAADKLLLVTLHLDVGLAEQPLSYEAFVTTAREDATYRGKLADAQYDGRLVVFEQPDRRFFLGALRRPPEFTEDHRRAVAYNEARDILLAAAPNWSEDAFQEFSRRCEQLQLFQQRVRSDILLNLIGKCSAFRLYHQEK